MDRSAIIFPPLREVLSAETVPELRKLAKGYYVEGTSKLKKAELIDAVTAALQERGRMEELLYVTDEQTWKLFRQIDEQGSVKLGTQKSVYYEILEELCYLRQYETEDGIVATMPLEIKKLFDEIVADGYAVQKERFDLIHAYALAAVNLYGIISQDDFVALFNQQNSEQVSVDECFPILVRHIAVGAPYCFWKEYLVSDEFEENEFQDVEDLAFRIGEKPRYIPDRSEFLRYADQGYFEHNAYTDALEQYLVETLHQNRMTARDIVEQIHYACMTEAGMQAVFDILEEYQIELRENQLRKVVDLIIGISNSTRLWSNNGHTPSELSGRAIRRPIIQAVSKKIGRNDPCPCGSGKKYKRCCGR
jgi:hypothetical protein